jgi:hypothetical protein
MIKTQDDLCECGHTRKEHYGINCKKYCRCIRFVPKKAGIEK